LTALIIATVVRQMWFELYEIPTGSMRPAFREQDRLSVTKTAFGLNIPLKTGHFYFDSKLVERGKVVVFSGDNLQLSDTDTTYFGIFPYKKRYIKRMIGKPGDTLYFYGGQIFGIDREGNSIQELLNDPWMKKNEYIPFLSFEGNTNNFSENKILLKQMNMPVGRYTVSRFTDNKGEIHNGKEWINENPFKETDNSKIEAYGDLWGIKNFGMARLITKEQLKKYTNITDINSLETADLYLQIKHSPNLTYPKPLIYKQTQGFDLKLPAFETIIPLNQQHIDAIMDNMYTARFEIEKGRPKRYKSDPTQNYSSLFTFPEITDGTYEFYNGLAEKVGFKGKTTILSNDHPFYNHKPDRVQYLFNFGIELYSGIDEGTFYRFIYPHRYVYFRNGDLYLMGAKVIGKEDPVLKKFKEKEQIKEKTSTKNTPYIAFKDFGPPIKNGELDVEFIKKFGITIPDKQYLVMGDNHAMSADSRVFGFVPEANLEGAPSLIIWPIGSRFGLPPQVPYPIFNIPRSIIWTLVSIILLSWIGFHRKKMQRRLFS